MLAVSFLSVLRPLSPWFWLCRYMLLPRGWGKWVAHLGGTWSPVTWQWHWPMGKCRQRDVPSCRALFSGSNSQGGGGSIQEQWQGMCIPREGGGEGLCLVTGFSKAVAMRPSAVAAHVPREVGGQRAVPGCRTLDSTSVSGVVGVTVWFSGLKSFPEKQKWRSSSPLNWSHKKC